MKYILTIFTVLLTCFNHSYFSHKIYNISPKDKYYLIAHRGGVVDSLYTENSQKAIEAAINKGYDMVEIDIRLTRDSVLIIHHDADFNRYYNMDKKVIDINWNQISCLRSSKDNSKVLMLEEALQLCSGKIDVMIDNKIENMNLKVANELIGLLTKYNLLDSGFMIGHRGPNGIFKGKLKLQLSKKDLVKEMEKYDYDPNDYFTFIIPPNEMSNEDIDWAQKNDVLIVAAINVFRYYPYESKKKLLESSSKDIDYLKNKGVKYFQIDSELDGPFFQSK